MYIVEMAIFSIYYIQRAATPKVVNQSYCSCVLHVFAWCITFVRSFIKISGTVFKLQSGHRYIVEMVMFNVQRAKTSKVDKPEF